MKNEENRPYFQLFHLLQTRIYNISLIVYGYATSTYFNDTCTLRATCTCWPQIEKENGRKPQNVQKLKIYFLAYFNAI